MIEKMRMELLSGEISDAATDTALAGLDAL
jgi:hypothetical protein